jgi:trans-2,3-dihydro-3-hydroxyanthranilate isomerase
MRFFIMDVFGNDKYSGNQLATFFDFGKLSTDEMQNIAREINFSETTFITSAEKVNDGFNVRIFTPATEIDFAGHPTLGTAHIISNYLSKDSSGLIKLNYRVGQIPVLIEKEIVWMRQNQPKFGHNLVNKLLLAQTLGLTINDFDNRYPIVEVTTGLPFTIVPLKTMDALKKAKVDLMRYNDFIEKTLAKGILIYTCETYEKHHDISSRVFVEYLGIPEDPATGSGTGCLAAYLLKYNVFSSNHIELIVGQGYEINRPSELRINSELKNGVYDINIGGKVIEIADGDWKTKQAS